MRVIRLQGRLDLGAAAALKGELVEALTAPVGIDAREVESIDTSCLQLLVAFTRDRGAPVQWQGASPAFTETAQRLGLAKLLAPESER
jgi:anti-anti-sigma regulatory factor